MNDSTDQNSTNTNSHDWLTPSQAWEHTNTAGEHMPLRKRVLAWISHNIGLTILIIGIFILVEIIWGISVLKKVGQEKTVPKVATLSNMGPQALFALSLPSPEVMLKQELQVAVLLDTANQNTDGATVVLRYDPKLLQYVRFENGTIFKEYLKLKVDEKIGKVTVSGIPELSGFYNGKGIFGYVIFTAKAKGATRLDFVHIPNATDETTMAANGKEIPSTAQGVEVTIR